MKVRAFRFLVVVILTLIVTHGLAQAVAGNIYYVATTGNDTNPGTDTKPFRTIQKAATLARAGDTIYVRGGVYKESVLLRYSGAPGQPITVKNYLGENPIIEPSI